MTHASESLGADPGPEKGWQTFWPVRLLKFIFIGFLWRYIGWPIVWCLRQLGRYCLVVLTLAFTNTVTFARTRWGWLMYGYEPSDDAFGRWVDKRVGEYMNQRSIRIPFTIGALLIGTPFMFISVLAIGFGIPVVICIAIDQMTYPRHELAEPFQAGGSSTQQELTAEQRGVLVTDALVYQLEYELDSAVNMSLEDWKTLDFNSFWGWTPNDMAGYGPLAWPRLFDNRANRQRGVIYAVRAMTEVWSQETSKLGSADRESEDLVYARQEGFGPSAEFWFFPASESLYRDGIEHVREYQRKLLAGASDAQINVTSKNLANVLRAMHKVLQEPHGRLVDRNTHVRWSELDDAVYYAQGSAIVIRDMLAALSVAYADDFRRGQLDRQVAEAIDSLNAAVQFNPWFILRGDGDAMLGDHRSKEARYITEAMGRLIDIAEALES